MLKPIILAGEQVRHLSAPPAFFGILGFSILAGALYLVLRLDRD
jgi:hypothetical protein